MTEDPTSLGERPPPPQGVVQRRKPGDEMTAISNLVVALTREYTGRGPTQARTVFGHDIIAVVLTDVLTRGETSLVKNGQSALVLSTRRTYQQTMSADMIAGVEDITGRRVLAFFSDNHIDPDMAVETFVLQPLATPDTPTTGI